VLRAALPEVIEDASNELGTVAAWRCSAHTCTGSKLDVPHRLVRRTHRHARAKQ
jgi:hypothetical protein